MANTVKLKRSSVQGKVPATGDLELGELALNTNDGVLFFKRDNGSESVVKVATTTNLLSYTRVTSNTTAASRQSYIADTSGGTFTITLPSGPASGDWVTIADGASFQTTALTVGRNSSTIADIAENLSLNIEGVSVTFVYDGSTWEVYTQVGAQGGDAGSSDVTGSSTTTFTNKTISGSSNTLSNIANSSLTNSSITVNGTSVSLGGSVTVSSVSGNAGTVTNGVYTTDTGSVTNTMLAGSIANAKLANSTISGISLGSNLATLTIGDGLTGTSYNGSTGVTIAVDKGPAFSAYPATSQTLSSSGTQSKILFGTEEFDTASCFSSSRFTPNVAGYYQINSTVRFDGGGPGTGECMIVIWKNGSEAKRGWNSGGTSFANDFFSMSVSGLIYLNGSTDYVEIYAQQVSGGNRTTTAYANISFFQGFLARLA